MFHYFFSVLSFHFINYLKPYSELLHFDSTCRWCLYPLALFHKSNKILSLPLFVEFSIDKNNIFFSFPSSYLKRVTPILMFVFISDIFECRIECKNSNDFSIGLWKGLVIFLFENTCGMWRRQRHTIMISVMCTLPMVYMCKLKYSGKMIKSYRFSMTPSCKDCWKFLCI